jgi:DNA repair protein REV1
MDHKVKKLQQSKQYPLISKIFLNCFIFVNGSTDPPRNEIHRLVCMHGGQFDSYQTSRTTHFLCDIFPNAKLKELRKRRQSTKLSYVTTQWLLESIAKGQKLLEGEYLPRGLMGQHGGSMVQYFSHTCPQRLSDDLINELEGEEAEGISDQPKMGSDVTLSDPPPLLMTASLPLHPSSTSSNLRLSVSLPSAPTSNLQPPSAHFSPSLRRPFERHPQSGAAGDPNFVNSYFETSRLHFLGSWKARLPTLLSAIQKEREIQAEEPTQLSLPFPIGE